uniref:Uncharacterized protein n=1 Tax=Acinetobacter pittii TaxID=48296 RepID=A0A075M9F0_ACIPI|nr:Hypothetical protein [Acinetobacter pittii]
MPEIRVDQEPYAQIFSDLPYPHFFKEPRWGETGSAGQEREHWRSGR